jgi:hypothetical protein
MQNGKAVDLEAQGNSLHECACSLVLIEGKWILRHACLTLAAPQQHDATSRLFILDNKRL